VLTGGTAVSPVNDGQDARSTNTGQSPEDRHSQSGDRERESVILTEAGPELTLRGKGGLSGEWLGFEKERSLGILVCRLYGKIFRKNSGIVRWYKSG